MAKGKLLFGTSLNDFDSFDMALFKLTLIAFTLFVVSAWNGFANWVVGTSWVWFLLAFIVFAIRPMTKLWRK